jgi:hypothetical protein
VEQYPEDAHEHELPEPDLTGLQRYLEEHHPEVDFEPADWIDEDLDDVLGNLMGLCAMYDLDFTVLSAALGVEIEETMTVIEVKPDSSGSLSEYPGLEEA